jgi:thiosulfate dehydrogenase [quinone] large subunit
MKDSRSLAYAILRVTMGAIFLFYGISKFLTGFVTVAHGMQASFAKTWLPSQAIFLFTLVLPFGEVAAGSLLILGWFTRYAAALAALLILVLTVGLTVAGNSDGVAQNLAYAIGLFILQFLAEHDKVSIDHWRKG